MRGLLALAVGMAALLAWGAETGHRLNVPWWKARLAEKGAQAQT